MQKVLQEEISVSVSNSRFRLAFSVVMYNGIDGVCPLATRVSL